VHPLRGGRLRAGDEDLVPVDAVPWLRAPGQLPPGGAEGVALQPPLPPPWHGLGPGEAPGEQLPGEATDQDAEPGVEAFAVAFGRAAVAAPDDWGQDPLEDDPDRLGDSAADGLESVSEKGKRGDRAAPFPPDPRGNGKRAPGPPSEPDPLRA